MNLDIINEEEEADIIVNTCCFINDQESINTILEMAQYKKKWKIEVLIVAGCLQNDIEERHEIPSRCPSWYR